VALRTAPVSADLTATAAPGTTAPFGSVTRPVICPVSSCAKAVAESAKSSAAVTKTLNFILAIIDSLRVGFGGVCGP
jgi:hypothetical protein